MALNAQPAVGACKVQGLCSAVDTQAAKQAPEVHLDGVLTDVEFFGNFAVGQALVQHQDQLLLAFGQFGRACWGGIFIGLFLFRDERSDSDAVIWRFEGHYGLIEVDPNASPTPDTVADVEQMLIPVPTIDVEAAIEHLDVEGGPFVFFLNVETGRGNVVYFRYDGHYGLIEPAE